VKGALWEGVLVAVIGAALAFAANALSPRGLLLTRNYFPSGTSSSPGVVPGTNASVATGIKTNRPTESLAARLQASGLQLADSNQVAQLFHDPRRAQDGVIFIDARDDEHYEAGHIPGAYHFYHYHPENYLSSIVPVCLAAQQIVFYCNGGDCEDSEHAAITLRDSLSLPREKVFVYGGGITEWMSNGLPVEVGQRNSGRLTNVTDAATSPKAEGSK
jgi:rhodanese-related sulfurtransferase